MMKGFVTIVCAAVILLLCNFVSVDAQGIISQATAVKLNGIVIDGRLDDWPKNLERYYIVNNGNPYGETDVDGENLITSDDLAPSFTVGYNPAENLIYIAVTVIDDCEAVGLGYSKTDGCEIYVEGTRRAKVVDSNFTSNFKPEKMAALQYVKCPPNGSYDIATASGVSVPSDLRLAGGDIKTTRTICGYSREGKTTIYEWAIEAYDQYPDEKTILKEGMKIGLDVVINDTDESGKPAWICWSKYKPLKFFNADSLGEITLGGSVDSLCRVSGTIKDPKSKKALPGFEFGIYQGGAEIKKSYSDRNGMYSIYLEPGNYEFRTTACQGYECATLKTFDCKSGAETSAKLSPKPLRIPSVLAKCAASYKNIQSYHDYTVIETRYKTADFEHTETVPYSISFQRPGNMRFESFNPSEDGGLTIFSNSKDFVVYNNYEGIYTFLYSEDSAKTRSITNTHMLTWETAGNILDFLFIMSPDPLDELVKNVVSISETGKEIINGQEAAIIKIEKPFYRLFPPRQRPISLVSLVPRENRIGTVTMAISKNDYSILRVSFDIDLDNIEADTILPREKEILKGTAAITINHFGIEKNRMFDDAYFTFIPPANAIYSSTIYSPSMVFKPRQKRLVGRQAPEFTLKDLDGKSVTLSGLKGNAVMLVFWASWNETCEQSMKMFQQMHDYSSRNDMELKIIGVNTLEDEEPDAIREYLGRNGITYPSLLDTDDTVVDQFGINKIPSCVIIDQKGRVEFAGNGQIDINIIGMTLQRLVSDPTQK